MTNQIAVPLMASSVARGSCGCIMYCEASPRANDRWYPMRCMRRRRTYSIMLLRLGFKKRDLGERIFTFMRSYTPWEETRVTTNRSRQSRSFFSVRPPPRHASLGPPTQAARGTRSHGRAPLPRYHIFPLRDRRRSRGGVHAPHPHKAWGTS